MVNESDTKNLSLQPVENYLASWMFERGKNQKKLFSGFPDQFTFF